jgi:hypothetical protein
VCGEEGILSTGVDLPQFSQINANSIIMFDNIKPGAVPQAGQKGWWQVQAIRWLEAAI